MSNKPSETKKEQKTDLKEKFNQIPDDTKKIGLALSALSTLAIAGVAIYKNKAPEQILEAGAKLQDGVSTVGAKLQDEVLEAGEKLQNEAQNIVTSTANNDKAAETIVKTAVNNAPVTKKITPANYGKENAKVVNETKSHAQNAKNVRQGMKNETNPLNITKKADEAKKSAEKARKNADNLAEKQNKTRKERIAATRANNNASKAEIQAKITEEKANNRLEQLAEENRIKQENIKELQASPNYKTGLKKMEQNAQKTQSKVVKRQANKELEKLEKKYNGKNSNQLMALVNNHKLSDTEEEAVLNILSKRGLV